MILFGFLLGIATCFAAFRLIQKWDKRAIFCFILDVDAEAALPEIERLIEGLKLTVLNKKLVRDDLLKFELRFKAHPFVQHVFFKRLLLLDGVGQIVKI
jgi:hypothetical protein